MASLSPVAVYTGNGAPSDATFPGSSPSAGTIYVDKLNTHVYVRGNAAWLLVDVASATTQTFYRSVLSTAAGSDLLSNVCIAPWNGTVSSVKFIAASTLTGANTDSRTLSLLNKSSDGLSSTSVASLAFTSGVDATADVPVALTLSVVAGATTVAAGEVLQWKSLHIGGTGLADTGGLVAVTMSRTP